MIPVSLSGGLFLLVALWLAFLAVLWIRELRRLSRHEWENSNRNLFFCPNCHYSFLTREPVHLSRCPRCNTICFRRSRRR